MVVLSSNGASVEVEELVWPGSDSAGAFKVGVQNGFLSVKRPLAKLPEKYAALESLLQEMPVVKPDGTTGLLGLGKIGEGIQNLALLDFSEENDHRVLISLFRDYAFLASAYIFEPCYHNIIQKSEMGLARNVLPKNVAQPLVYLAERLKLKPFLDYASYALLNWQKKDEDGGMDFENLKLIRSFTGDPSEAGFILVHVVMNEHSGKLVGGASDFLKSVREKNEEGCELSMECLLDTLRHINKEMNTMWTRNKHESYGKYRVFIFGSKNQPILPNGLIYEGVSDEPRFYRGESGACDSIIPLMDNILELTLQMPDNELTAILRDFRSCRPNEQQVFLQWAEEEATRLKAKEFAIHANPVHFLKLLDQVREFRSRHWNFAKMYVMQHTRYPVATGGSPIIKWLPNQLMVVHNEIQRLVPTLDTKHLSEKELKFCGDLLKLSQTESTNIKKQVKDIQANFQTAEKEASTGHQPNQTAVYEKEQLSGLFALEEFKEQKRQ